MQRIAADLFSSAAYLLFFSRIVKNYVKIIQQITFPTFSLVKFRISGRTLGLLLGTLRSTILTFFAESIVRMDPDSGCPSRLLDDDGIHGELSQQHIADNNKSLPGADLVLLLEPGHGVGDSLVRTAWIELQHDGMDGTA